MRGEITFQRGTAGRIIRRWEEVATKQTNSLLLICSAQRAYARSTLAGLLCIFRKAPQRALRKAPYRQKTAPECRAKCPISGRCGRLTQACRAAGCGRAVVALPASSAHRSSLSGRPPRRFTCCFEICSATRARGWRRRLSRSSALPWPAGSRGTRRCARCSSAPTGRRNRCRSSAPPPPGATAPSRSCPR